jgi:hypothetical protein
MDYAMKLGYCLDVMTIELAEIESLGDQLTIDNILLLS